MDINYCLYYAKPFSQVVIGTQKLPLARGAAESPQEPERSGGDEDLERSTGSDVVGVGDVDASNSGYDHIVEQSHAVYDYGCDDDYSVGRGFGGYGF